MAEDEWKRDFCEMRGESEKLGDHMGKPSLHLMVGRDDGKNTIEGEVWKNTKMCLSWTYIVEVYRRLLQAAQPQFDHLIDLSIQILNR